MGAVICGVGEVRGLRVPGGGGELRRRRRESGRPVGIEETKGAAAARGWVVVTLGGRKSAVILRIFDLSFVCILFFCVWGARGGAPLCSLFTFAAVR